MKKNISILMLILLMTSVFCATPGAAKDPRIFLTVPTEAPEGTTFDISAQLDGGFEINPEDPYNITIIFVDVIYYTTSGSTLTLTAPLVDSDTNYSITANKTGYPDKVRYIMIRDVPEVPELLPLVIDAPFSSEEDISFTITITADNQPISGVTVTFNGQQYTTNTLGQIQLTAPSVDEDKTLPIAAEKEGYLSDSTSILIQDVSQIPDNGDTYGWITGTITNGNDQTLSSVTITASSTENDYTTTTGSTGTYTLQLPSGTYTVKASRTGYVTNSVYNIFVRQDVSTQVDIILEAIGEPPAQTEPYDEGALAVNWGIQQQVIGAEISASEQSTESKIYNSDISLVISSAQDNLFEFTITGPDGSEGTIVAINFENAQELFNTSVINLTNIVVTYDGSPITMAETFSDLFNPSEPSSDPVWAAVVTGHNITALVRIPHFSEHVITFSALPMIPEPLRGLALFVLYGITIVVLAILTAIPIVRLWRKIE